MSENKIRCFTTKGSETQLVSIEGEQLLNYLLTVDYDYWESSVWCFKRNLHRAICFVSLMETLSCFPLDFIVEYA